MGDTEQNGICRRCELYSAAEGWNVLGDDQEFCSLDPCHCAGSGLSWFYSGVCN